MRYFVSVLLLVVIAGPSRAWCQSCGVAATGLAFGTYQPFSGVGVNSTATITVTCTPGQILQTVSYQIQIGTGTGGSFAARSMGGGNSTLSYQLYSDPLYTQVWGDGTGGTVAVSDGYLLGLSLPVIHSFSCYGSIPARQRVSVGSYTDVISVLISY